ncbi:MAG: transposase [Bacteroidales bacterium]|nr:transposase [Bacteroidales bacterium]
MGKDMIIKILQDQLEASNATILRLNITIQNMQSSFDATAADLKTTIANLEALLQERDASLTKAKNQMRGLSKLTEKKSERQKPQPPAPKTEEERQSEQERKAAERKARGNNGARRNMHFEMETVFHDAYPAGLFESPHKAMRKAVKEDRHLCCDETHHKILVKADDNGGKGSRKGYIRAIVAAHTGLACFFYDDGSHSEDVILNELKGYEGTIQSDGLKAYKKVAAQSNGKMLRLSCLQQCKRDFVDMKGNPDADEILSLTNQPYVNEHLHRRMHSANSSRTAGQN